jgi:branched-chain amino acid transport system permease protein
MDPNEILKFLRLTYTGLSDGTLLALIALGLVLVYKSTDVINFAHGDFMMMGAYMGFQTMVWAEPIANDGIIAIVGVIVMIVGAVAIGVTVERLVLRPLIGESVISVIMVTIGLSNVIQAIVGGIWGKLPQRMPVDLLPSFTERGRFEITLDGARRPLFLQDTSLVAIFVVLLLVLGLISFFRFSRQGIAMRATADDQQAAMSMGISIKVIFAITWSLATVTAGIAGLLVADITNSVSADISGVALRAFPVIILGGLDSIAGAIIGGIAIGLIEQYASGYIDPGLKNVVPYIVLLIVLMVRPYGLFGQKIIERV